MWNYRVLKEGEVLSIVEVYYNDFDEPISYCEASLDNWEGFDELKDSYNAMASALKKPVLTMDDFI